MEKKDCWFILELETGFIDGWYHTDKLDTPEEVRRYWDEIRPKYTHLIAITDKNLIIDIPDKRLLGNSLI